MNKTLCSPHQHYRCFLQLENQSESGLSSVFFFDLFANMTVECGHDVLEDSVLTPLFVMPKYRGIGGKVFGEVNPIASIFELIENTV